MSKIIVNLGIDTAQYETKNENGDPVAEIDLSKWATDCGKYLRECFPDVKFSVSAFEDDNAETAVEIPDDVDVDRESIESAVQEFEGKNYSDPDYWIANE